MKGRYVSSIKTKATLLTVCEIVVAIVTVAVLGVVALNRFGNNASNEILELMCKTGERNLDMYFGSVEQSVETVSGYATTDLARTDLNDLSAHLERVGELFEKTASNTNGILTYYYRIDPAVSANESGFWYVHSSRDGFVPHTVTDITQYDTNDQSSLVWFTVPKATGKSIWLSPYVTDNLDVYVLSYNVPIYKGDTFVGVIGIEIDYTTVSEVVDSIKLYDNGYAFINDDEGNIVYHPHIDVPRLAKDEIPKAPDGLLDGGPYVNYTYDGIEKRGIWMPLENGMRLNVSVPVKELNRDWRSLANTIALTSLTLLVAFIVLTSRYMTHITKPLKDLTEAAEQLYNGNYDVELSYDGNDEVGLLTRTVRKLVLHLKEHIEELSSLAYADALTHVHNKGAFGVSVRELQASLEAPGERDNVEFAIGVFDCDYLKRINDQYGHDKGDVYLQTSCGIICDVFEHSPVFRIGGDEFAVVLQGDDYENRVELKRRFDETCDEQRMSAKNPWEEISVSVGIATFDPSDDDSVDDVVRRADKLMYETKLNREAARK